MFWLKTWYEHVFLRKLETFVIFWGEMQEISALQASIDSQIFSKFQSNICLSHTHTLV